MVATATNATATTGASVILTSPVPNAATGTATLISSMHHNVTVCRRRRERALVPSRRVSDVACRGTTYPWRISPSPGHCRSGSVGTRRSSGANTSVRPSASVMCNREGVALRSSAGAVSEAGAGAPARRSSPGRAAGASSRPRSVFRTDANRLLSLFCNMIPTPSPRSAGFESCTPRARTARGASYPISVYRSSGPCDPPDDPDEIPQPFHDISYAAPRQRRGGDVDDPQHGYWNRRRFLAGTAATMAALIGTAGVFAREADASPLSETPPVRDTINGVLAFVVPGNDPYSHQQGVWTDRPGGVTAGTAESLERTLDQASPMPLLGPEAGNLPGAAAIAVLLNTFGVTTDPRSV